MISFILDTNQMKDTLFVFCKRFSIGIILFFLGQICFSQSIGKQSRFTTISASEGMPNSVVNAIVQDGNGFYWFATDDGLCRYDGSHIIIYKNSAKDIHSLPHNRIFDLTVDSIGNLWVATSYGIVRYNNQHNNFDRFSPENGYKNIPNQYITNIHAQGNTIWFSTPSAICKIDATSLKIDAIPVPSKINNKQAYIHTMYLDKRGNIWLCIDGYIYNYQTQTGKFKELEAYSNILIKEINQLASSIFSSNDTLWLGTSQGTVYQYLIKDNSIKQIPIISNTKQIGINGFYKDKNGRINVLLDKVGMGFYNKSTNSIQIIENNYFRLIDNCSIVCTYIDSNKNLWFGHKKNGICYSTSQHVFDVMNTNFEAGTFLTSNTISAVLYDSNHSIWLGTDGGGLYKKSAATGDYFIPQKALSSDCILSLFEDSKGRIWCGTYRDGIYQLEKNGKIENHYIKTENNGLGSNDIRAIAEDKNGILWFNSHGAGITSFNTQTKQFKNYSTLTKPAISGDWTYDIICSHDDKIWIATNYGLSCLSADRKTATIYLSDQKSKSLTNNNAYCLFEDKNKNVWCGTQEGLSCFEAKLGTFSQFLTNKEIAIQTISQDKHGYIWVGTNLGLYKLQSNGQIAEHFNHNTQLNSDCFVQRSKSNDSKGTFYFGTSNGLVTFNPDKIQSTNKLNTLKFTNISINNTSIFDNNFEHLHFTLNKDSILALPYYQNTLSFSFADIDWLNSNRGELYYQLLGIDEEAKACNGEREVSYNNIPPGSYIFKLGYLENGIFKAQQNLQCIIERQWWLRWWAFVLYSFILSLLLWAFYRYVKITTTANNMLMIEQNKTKQMEDLYEAKLRFFTNISHDIRNPLTLIANPVNNLLAKKDLDAESRTLLTIMKRNTNQLLQLVNELLEFRKIEAGMVKLSLRPYNIVSIANYVLDDFQNQAFQRNISLQCSSESAVLVANIEAQYFEKAIYNLLSNAFKFTPDSGQIKIHVYKHIEQISEGKIFKIKQSKSYVAIEVRDSGQGIPEELRDKIFERFYEGKNPSGTESSGIGLSIVKSIIEQHGGFVKVENQQGAVFTLYVPFEENSSQVVGINEVGSKIDDQGSEITNNYTNNLKSQTVLIVEDNDDLRAYLELLLSKHYSTIKAKNGNEAFEMALSFSPDLILSDVMMPEMNGIDLCIKLKNSLETSHIPVILLTARNIDEAQREGLKAGADDYITKPFVDEVLLLKINNILTTREQLRTRFSTENKDITEIANTSADAQFMTKFMTMVEKDYTDCDLSVEKIGETIGLSRSQLYKKCLALTGKSPVDIVQEIRMQNALNLLKSTSLTISEIAYSVGYSDPRYFSNRFKKMIGATPSELRERQG